MGVGLTSHFHLQGLGAGGGPRGWPGPGHRLCNSAWLRQVGRLRIGGQARFRRHLRPVGGGAHRWAQPGQAAGALSDAWGGAGAHSSPFCLPDLRPLLSSLKNSLSFLPFFLLCPCYPPPSQPLPHCFSLLLPCLLLWPSPSALLHCLPEDIPREAAVLGWGVPQALRGGAGSPRPASRFFPPGPAGEDGPGASLPPASAGRTVGSPSQEQKFIASQPCLLNVQTSGSVKAISPAPAGGRGPR